MSNFKIGDKVTCVKEFTWLEQGIILEYGSLSTVKAIGDNGNLTFNGLDYWNPDRFELVEEEKQMFDLKKEKWFIKTPTPEISEAVQEWLFEQGLTWVTGDTKVKHLDKSVLSLDSYGKFGWNDSPENYDKNNKEIKFTFKTVIDTIEYPEPTLQETESEKELKALEQKIQELSEQASKLRKTLP